MAEDEAVGAGCAGEVFTLEVFESPLWKEKGVELLEVGLVELWVSIGYVRHRGDFKVLCEGVEIVA